MINYKCSHSSKGILILDSNPLTTIAYFEWAESVGVDGSREKCWDCWNKEHDKLVEELKEK